MAEPKAYEPEKLTSGVTRIWKKRPALGQGVCFSRQRHGVLHTVQHWKGICCYTVSLKAVQRAHSKCAAAKD
ncbi:hypothetical protein N8622_01455 [bacterium]|nr:hypothetical protein [bacterium]